MAQSTDPSYVGRFAPSPTGPLHLGSLLAATASYLEARSRRGRWFIRIEDIDPPREQPGADEAIVRVLDHYGFEWDGPIVRQSESRTAHLEAIGTLVDRQLAYPCGCSRRDLKGAQRGALGTIYPGTCRSGCDQPETAIRVLTHNEPVGIDDRLQGRFAQRLETESGDFIIHRRDGLIAYQLAAAVDDAHNGITDVVRGIDLLDSTPRQIYLQTLLKLPTPTYAHIPVIQHEDGSKLSKLTGADPVPVQQREETLWKTLRALQQDPPDTLREAPLAELWAWAFEHWQLEQLVGRKGLALQRYF